MGNDKGTQGRYNILAFIPSWAIYVEYCESHVLPRRTGQTAKQPSSETFRELSGIPGVLLPREGTLRISQTRSMTCCRQICCPLYCHVSE